MTQQKPRRSVTIAKNLACGIVLGVFNAYKFQIKTKEFFIYLFIKTLQYKC